jgi:hypothetical protein
MPSGTAGPCDLSGPDFWLDLPIPTSSLVQGAITDALQSTGVDGAIQVRLLPTDDVDSPGVVVAVGPRVVGLLPGCAGVVDLAEALGAHQFTGACRALVIEDGGLYGLRLDLDPAYLNAPPMEQDATL